MADSCEGFFFRYFTADAEGFPIETKVNDHFLEAENKILTRVSQMLKGRPDLMKKVMCIENGLEIHLYQGTEFKDFEDEIHFFGRATFSGDQNVLELATDEVLYGGQKNHDVLDVIVHELIHVLDFLDDEDGLLPGWNNEEFKTYTNAREYEKSKIKQGESLLDPYALTNDKEFLAVLAETFFIKPSQLKKENESLYALMRDFFKIDPSITND